MREIKFRAYSERENNMFNVDVLAISECTWGCPDFGKRGVSIAYQPSIKVMQYTGIKDSNGVEIYEGDIIRSFASTGVEVIHVIQWSETAFIARWHKDESYPSNHGFTQEWITKYKKEVIGNIYQHPELLK